jgi:uncharacterized membrane protein YphA (DoxX/SURF4 family)
MPALTLSTALQLIIGAGLLNVWLLRAGNQTAYRGGSAQTLRQEFDAYGLPSVMFFVVGTLKILAGIILIAGLWIRLPVTLAAGVVALLMLGALAMHLRVKDPLLKSVPAGVMLALCATLLLAG